MKVGDLIKLKPGLNYPQYTGKTGVLIESRWCGAWIVMIDGKLHSYIIHEEDMAVICENR
jgi:hypothetical protein